MERNYHALPSRALGEGAGFRRPTQAQPHVTLESPAREVMTDLTRVSPATIGPQEPVAEANQYMMARGVRLLLVIDEQERVLGVISATDVLGERPMRVATARGLRRDELTVADIMTPAESVEVIALAERHSTFIKEMALMIGRRLRASHDSITSLAVDPVEARLAATLLRLAKREGMRSDQGVALPFHLTRQSLADMTGTTVETAIRILSRWLRDGLLGEDGDRLVLTDWEGLGALAEGEAD